MNPIKDHPTEEIRQQILTAAEQRFRFYGYNKTTMAEIAKDCNMSAANLYRYFDNKLAIAVALARGCLAESENQLLSIVNQPEISASERIRNFVFETLRYTYTQWSETPRINEMVEAVCQERMDIVKQHMDSRRTSLVGLLEQGVRQGEFAVPDPQKTAGALLTAVTLFDVPMLMPLFSLDALEQKAEALAELIINGLKKP
ncbi:TetR/AcrR family transcriptional regulator [Kaarinaea lacus]